MNKITKAKAKYGLKGVILGTSEPIVVTPLKNRKPLPNYKGRWRKKLLKIKRNHPWAARPKSPKKISAFKQFKANERKAKAYGTSLAQPNWGKGMFTGMYSGGAIETNRRKH